MNRKRPVFPPTWAPKFPTSINERPLGAVIITDKRLPGSVGIRAEDWALCCDRAAKDAFQNAAGDRERAIVVEEYLLSNVRVALRSEWLREEILARVFQPRDPVIRKYAEVLMDYIPRVNQYREPVALAQSTNQYRKALMSDPGFKLLWKRVLKYRHTNHWPRGRRVSPFLVRGAVHHFRSDQQFLDIHKQLPMVPARKAIPFDKFVVIFVKAPNRAAAATELTAMQFGVSRRIIESLWRNPEVMAALH